MNLPVFRIFFNGGLHACFWSASNLPCTLPSEQGNTETSFLLNGVTSKTLQRMCPRFILLHMVHSLCHGKAIL